MNKIAALSAFVLGLTISPALSRADGGPPYFLQKVQSFTQIDGSGAIAAPAGAYIFSANAPTAVTKLNLPGSGNITLVFNSNDSNNQYVQLFASKTALDAAFPNGTYSYASSPAVSLALTGDAYPAATPQITSASSGTWTNGVLMLDPAVSNTLQFNPFTTYATGSAFGHMEIDLDSQNNGNTSLKQDAFSSAAFSGSANPAFSSFPVNSGVLTAGGIYQCEISYDAVTVYDSNAGGVALYTNDLSFYIVGKSATTVAAPAITAQPSNQTGSLGDTVNFNLSISNLTTGFAVNWYKDGQQLNLGGTTKYFIPYNTNPTGASLTVKTLVAADAGTYYVDVVTAGGLVRSNPVTLSIVAPSQPVITSQPVSVIVNPGGTASFTVGATGGGLSYQWKHDGVNIGTSQSTLTINNAQTGAAGSYSVIVTNSVGSATSNAATLTVNTPQPPVITVQPQPVTVATGASALFNVSATGTGPFTFAWKLNGVNQANSNNSRFLVSNVQPGAPIGVSVLITNSVGSVLSNTANLTAVNTADPGRLVNLSVLSVVPSTLTMGFVIGGTSSTNPQNVLIRATGPALALPPFNVPGVMIDPTLTVVKQSNGTTLATNAGWGSNAQQITDTDSAVGAFALTDTHSHDSAVVAQLPVSNGGYTATVTGTPGNALTEVYDATAAGTYTATTPRLVNLSCLTTIAPGGALTVGFVLGGTTAKTLLVRVSGPTLAQAPFSIGGTMTDPKLTVQPLSNANTTLAANAGWGGNPLVASVAASVGAFAFFNGSTLDSAALVTLTAGIPYTVQVSSAGGGGGLVLVEIYDVP